MIPGVSVITVRIQRSLIVPPVTAVSYIRAPVPYSFRLLTHFVLSGAGSMYSRHLVSAPSDLEIARVSVEGFNL